MYQIASKRELNPTVTQMEIVAPLVAKKAKPGQFIILRVDEEGERIPLTVAGCDPVRGTVKIIFQVVGATTVALNAKAEGDFLCDFVGPLGAPTETEGVKSVCIVGGGVGCAIAMPIAEAFHELGAEVTSIVGFRSRELVILEKEFDTCSDSLTVMTDDGSYGRHGNVTLPLREMLEEGRHFDRIITIGPLIMMKFVVETARPFGVPVTVSMNPIMIDGTGMCGGCRLTLHRDGKAITKFACVDGPDFDGYEVDFDEAVRRASCDEIVRRYYKILCDGIRSGHVNTALNKIELVMNQAGVTTDDRPVVAAALAKSAATEDKPAAALELPDGRIVTGKTSSLLGPSAAVLLNALKAMSGIDEDTDVISHSVIEPIQKMKTGVLGNHNPRLHSDEVLIALAISAGFDPNSAEAIKHLPDLRGCEAHSTVILAQSDDGVFRKLGIHMTCEPKYTTKKLYHKP